MFGLAVRKVVLSILTKLSRDSTLENEVEVVARNVLAIAINGLRVKVEKKIRHYILSSREWINMLYVTPKSEDHPLGLIDRQSRLSLGSTDTGGNGLCCRGYPGYSLCV